MIGFVAALVTLVVGFAAGRGVGVAEGRREGAARARLEDRLQLLTAGYCPLCKVTAMGESFQAEDL